MKVNIQIFKLKTGLSGKKNVFKSFTDLLEKPITIRLVNGLLFLYLKYVYNGVRVV